MKVAVVHSFYSAQNSSGENNAVLSQVDLLRKAGHEVELFKAETDELNSNFSYKIRTALKVALGYGLTPTRNLKKFKPDVVLVHNLFPNFGSNWMRQWSGPMIRVLHNYRLFCANGIFFRDGKICFDCVTKSPFQSVINSCYRETRVATLPLFVAQLRRRAGKPELNAQSMYVALSGRASEILIRSGLEQLQVRVIENFIEDFSAKWRSVEKKRENRWVAVGRITREKGFLNLVKNWPSDIYLDIIGDGPDLDEVKAIAQKNEKIEFLGQLEKRVIQEKLFSYQGAIYPSIWSEVSPLVVIEYFCAGLPVIALELHADMVASSEEYSSGIVLEYFTAEELQRAIAEINLKHSIYAEKSRKNYEHNFHPSSWLNKIENLMYSLVENNNFKDPSN
jgi:glycosyltransferase involved in cell wall biosynthesis